MDEKHLSYRMRQFFEEVVRAYDHSQKCGFPTDRMITTCVAPDIIDEMRQALTDGDRSDG